MLDWSRVPGSRHRAASVLLLQLYTAAYIALTYCFQVYCLQVSGCSMPSRCSVCLGLGFYLVLQGQPNVVTDAVPGMGTCNVHLHLVQLRTKLTLTMSCVCSLVACRNCLCLVRIRTLFYPAIILCTSVFYLGGT